MRGGVAQLKSLFSLEEALAEIERCAGKQFDPKLAKIFIKLARERRGWLN